MPQKLFAAIPFGKYNDFIVDDEATIVMEYDNGKTGTFILSTGEACHEERLEIIGTKARILLEDDTLTITRHRDVCEYIKNEEVNSRQNSLIAMYCCIIGVNAAIYFSSEFLHRSIRPAFPQWYSA